jgi:1-acyl-sn-glycerol-3-phosphate acyltransferase
MAYPKVGDALPKRTIAMLEPLARVALTRLGWQVVGEIPNIPQLVAVGAPHTSSRDFFVGMLLIFALGLRVSWMGKHSLFRWPIGGIMRWLGGLAIDRSGRHKVVDQVVQVFTAEPSLIVALMPEGSRKRAGIPVKEWKTGFYYIALGAHVPILPLRLDNANKQIIFGPLLHPTGDSNADLARLQEFYYDSPTLP